MGEQHEYINDEIYLTDILWYLCFCWKKILLGIILFMILAGGYSYCKQYQKTEHMEKILSGGIKLSDKEEKDVDYFLLQEELYENYKEYLTQSPLMKLDANNVSKIKISYYIDNYFTVEYPAFEKSNNINGIINSYLSELNSEELRKSILDQLGMEQFLLYKECLQLFTYTEDTGELTLEICVESEEEGHILGTIISGYLLEQKKGISKKMGSHDFILLGKQYTSERSEKLSEYQSGKWQILESLKLAYAEATTALSEELLDYASYFKGDQVLSHQSNISIKYLVLGGIGGAFLSICYSLLLYFMDSKLGIRHDLDKIFEIDILSIIKQETKKEHWLKNKYYTHQLFLSVDKASHGGYPV